MWQAGLGCLPMIPLGLWLEGPDIRPLSLTGALMLGYVTIVGMIVCYLTWFATLRHLPPARAAVGMLLVPLIGVIAGALIFHEPLGLRQAAAVALTLGGVALALERDGGA